jgi:serine/threonine protein kinase
MLGEAVLLCRLDHPNIIRVFDANVVTLHAQDFGFFTMEYIAGGSLDQFWRSFGTQFVPVPTAVDLIKQVCRGLSAAHGQSPPVIHRDIKPQNILIGYEVDGGCDDCLGRRGRGAESEHRQRSLRLEAAHRSTNSARNREHGNEFERRIGESACRTQVRIDR